MGGSSQKQEFTQNLPHDYLYVTGFGGPPMPVTFDEQLARVNACQDLSLAPLDFMTAIAADFKLFSVTLHANQAIFETVTINMETLLVGAYATHIAQWTLLGERYVFFNEDNLIFIATDEIRVRCTNAGGAGTVCMTLTYGLR